MSASPSHPASPRGGLAAFASDVVDRVRAAGNTWQLPGGQIVLPRVFGFCRGVERALAMLDEAVSRCLRENTRLFLLGQIIHNPWVNAYFQRRGVTILTAAQCRQLRRHLRAEDCAVIPAFGVPPDIERQLSAIGCQIVDTTCGDVRRLWLWAEKAARSGFGVLIFGRATHDETVVTKSRLAAEGGSYVVAGDLEEVGRFCRMIEDAQAAADFAGVFGPQATNAASVRPFARLAQVSQTTMLYSETIEVRSRLRAAFAAQFGCEGLEERLVFQPTVCRATQDRQEAAVELCRSGCDVVAVVGGFGSSNTRHLYELAKAYAPAVFIEDADAIVSADELHTMDPAAGSPIVARDWLPRRRPMRVGVLAGASSPEIVIGQVLQKIASLLA